MSQRIEDVTRSVLIMLICTVLLIWMANLSRQSEQTEDSHEIQKIEVWYAATEYQPYLTAAAQQFEQQMKEQKKSVAISLKQFPVLEYTADIEQGIKSGEGPDVYLTDTSSLQNFIRIRAAARTEETDTYSMKAFNPEVWKNMEYQGNNYGYPLGFDSVVLMYHKDSADSDSKLPQYLSEIYEEAVNCGDAEKILNWNRSSFLINYGFLAAYVNAGGENGDQAEIDIDNEKVIQCAELFQQYSMYFPENEEKTEEIIENVRNGNLKYAVVSTNALTGDAAQQAGFMKLPDWDKELKTKPVAITDLLMVNPASDQKDIAAEFARYCSLTVADQMYTRCGVLPLAEKGELPKGSKIFYESYEDAAGLPKIRTLTDYWSRVRETMIKIKNGADVENILHDLQKQLEIQIEE